jgi:two-component system, chemotaxis family, protein-glutamate methylesterase/glutaminase
MSSDAGTSKLCSEATARRKDREGTMRQEQTRDRLLIATSMGGVDALSRVLKGLILPSNVSVYIVLHRFKTDRSDLGDPITRFLSRETGLQVEVAQDGAPLEPGKIVLGPGDTHLILMEDRIRLGRGPRENRHRPSADVLFRSAAIYQAGRSVGVTLTGATHDGASGLLKLVQAGGLAAVQCPDDALSPTMPQAALDLVPGARVATLSEMPGTVLQLLEEGRVETPPPSPTAIKELSFALEPKSDIQTEEEIGELTPVSCPECGGALWHCGEPSRFRCHTGHAYTQDNLLEAQGQEVERALYVALRMLEERVYLLKKYHFEAGGPALADRLHEAEQQVALLRQVLLGE